MSEGWQRGTEGKLLPTSSMNTGVGLCKLHVKALSSEEKKNHGRKAERPKDSCRKWHGKSKSKQTHETKGKSTETLIENTKNITEKITASCIKENPLPQHISLKMCLKLGRQISEPEVATGHNFILNSILLNTAIEFKMAFLPQPAFMHLLLTLVKSMPSFSWDKRCKITLRCSSTAPRSSSLSSQISSSSSSGFISSGSWDKSHKHQLKGVARKYPERTSYCI